MMDTEETLQLLTTQMPSIGNSEASLAVLGVAVGEDRYLIPMAEVSEVIAIPK